MSSGEQLWYLWPNVSLDMCMIWSGKCAVVSSCNKQYYLVICETLVVSMLDFKEILKSKVNGGVIYSSLDFLMISVSFFRQMFFFHLY